MQQLRFYFNIRSALVTTVTVSIIMCCFFVATFFVHCATANSDNLNLHLSWTVVITAGASPSSPIPPARHSHIAGVLQLDGTGDGNKTRGTEMIVLSHGFSADNLCLQDTWLFSLTTFRWRQLSLRLIPPPRHSAASVSVNHLLYIFGGDSCISHGSYLNDLWIFSSDTKSWTEVIYRDNFIVPSPRAFSTLVQYNGVLVLYGGMCTASLSCRDTWIYDISTQGGWRELKDDASPLSRYGHTALSYNSKMIVFGGYSTSSEAVLSDLWIFDITILKWKQVENLAKSALWPVARAYHTACHSESGMIVLGGGRCDIDGKCVIEDDVWSFSYEELTWHRLFPRGDDHPLQRFRHSALFVSSLQAVVVYGGESMEPHASLSDMWVLTNSRDIIDRFLWSNLKFLNEKDSVTKLQLSTEELNYSLNVTIKLSVISLLFGFVAYGCWYRRRRVLNRTQSVPTNRVTNTPLRSRLSYSRLSDAMEQTTSCVRVESDLASLAGDMEEYLGVATLERDRSA